MQSSSDSYSGSSNSFSPANVEVAREGVVTWANNTGVTHNVTFASVSGAPANIPNHTSGTTNRSFPSTGRFAYECTVHAGMSGAVVVR